MSKPYSADYFDFSKRRYEPLSLVRRRMLRGEGMNVFFDSETSALDRQGVPYATPNYADLNEVAFTVGDVNGNFYGTKRFLIQKHPAREGDISAKIVTRLDGHDEWESQFRLHPQMGVAASVRFLRDVEKMYGDVAEHYGDVARKVSFRDYNRAFHNNDDIDFDDPEAVANIKAGKAIQDPNTGMFYKPESGDVYDIKAWDDKTDSIVTVARFHPGRGIGGAYAVKFDRFAKLADGSDNPFYGQYDNNFYIDQETGETFVWTGRSLGIDIFNANFDTKVFAANLQRANYFGQDAAMLYSRSMRGPRQEGRWYVRDAMELLRAGQKYGPQDANGIKIAEYIDLKTGRVNRPRTQAAYLESNKNLANPYQLTRPKIYSPQDGSFHDPHKDHDGHYDTLWGFAAARYTRSVAPDIAEIQDKMAVRDNQDEHLNAKDPDGQNWPFFVLPVQKGPKEQDGVYLYDGKDVFLGDMNKRIYLRLDEDLSEFKNYSAEDWADFIRGKQGKKAIVKLEKVGVHHIPLSLEFVRTKTSAGEVFADKDPQIIKNLIMLEENPGFLQSFRAGIENINRDQRFTSFSPAVPLPEDEYFLRYATGVNFNDYHAAFKDQEELANDPVAIENIRASRDMIKRRMDDDFKYMQKVSRAILYMAGRADMIDSASDVTDVIDRSFDENGQLSPLAKLNQSYFQEYKETCTRLFRDVLNEQNAKPYVDLLRSLEKADGNPFIDPEKNVFNMYGLNDAYAFRNALCKKIMDDRVLMMRNQPEHPHLQGFANVADFKKSSGNEDPLLILPDPSPGEKQGSAFGAPPFIRDIETGHKIEPEMIARLSAQSGGRDIITQMVKEKKWDIVFYSFRSDALMKGIIERCMIKPSTKPLIPQELYPAYVEDWTYRQLGFPNEDVADSRIPTLLTQKRDLQSIMAGSRDSRTLQRAPAYMRRTVDAVTKHEEGARLVAQEWNDLDKRIKTAEKVRNGLKVSRYHKESGLPYDYIDYQFDRDSSKVFLKDPNFVVLDVSVWQMRQALENMDIHNGLPLQGIAIPNIPKHKRDAIHKGKPVLFRVKETGQIYSGGHVTLAVNPLVNKGSLQEVFAQAASYLQDAGRTLKAKDTLYYVGVDKLMPLAGTRHVDYSQQTVLMPNSRWYSLTAPELFDSNNKNHIVTHIAPADYVRQKFELNKPILLCHSDTEAYAEMQGNTTKPSGQSYMSILEDAIGINRETGKVEGISLDEFEGMIRSHTLDERFVTGAGYLDADHFNAIRRQWTSKLNIANPGDQKIVALTFQRVNKTYQDGGRKDELKNSWGYAPVSEAPEAALRVDGEQYPPNAFQNVLELE